MEITRRQFGIAMVLGIFALALSRMFGFLFRRGSGRKEVAADGHPARYWKRADHLGG